MINKSNKSNHINKIINNEKDLSLIDIKNKSNIVAVSLMNIYIILWYNSLYRIRL